jgi:hypothetical protein
VKFDAFDLWSGANFRLRAKKVDGFQSYEESVFDAPGPLDKSDDKLESVWKSEFSLLALVDPKKFPAYDDLKKRMEKVLGLTGSPSAPKTVEQAKASVAKMVKEDAPEPAPWDTSEGDDSMEYFQKLAES